MAYEFNGTNQYLSCASAPASGSPMTIAAWAYRSNNARTDAIFGIGQNAGTHRNQLSALNGGAVRAYSEGTGGAGFADTTATSTVNTWFHVCGVFAGAASRSIYLNGGNFITNTFNVGTQNAASGMQIGCRIASNSAGFFFLGRLSEVGIWNVALTAAEVASLAKGMTCDKVRPQSLVFYAPLVRDILDQKGGLTITNNNGATVANHPRVYA
jgi:hypothetical protein